jgi:hypothetical protein
MPFYRENNSTALRYTAGIEPSIIIKSWIVGSWVVCLYTMFTVLSSWSLEPFKNA